MLDASATPTSSPSEPSPSEPSPSEGGTRSRARRLTVAVADRHVGSARGRPDRRPAASGRVRRWARRPGRPLVTFLARATAAAGGGVLLYLSFPPRTLWWLALPAFALLGAAVHGRSRPRRVRLRARCSGSASCCRCCAGPASTSARCRGWRSRAPRRCSSAPRAPGWPWCRGCPAGGPLWAAAVWVAGEALRARVPFGGFPWGRVAFGQPDGPLLPVAAVGGAPLLSFVDGAGRARARRGRAAAWPGARAGRRRARAAGARRAARQARSPRCCRPRGRLPARTVTIAAVQGNVPRLGLDFNAQRRAVLDNHVRVTEQLAADVAAGLRPRPDLVIWPENSSDIDPLRNPDAAAAIDRAARAVGVPIVVGRCWSANPDEARTATNSALVWEPGVGPSTAPTSAGCSPSASTCRGGRSSGCSRTTPTGPATSSPGRARAPSTWRASGSGSRSAGRSPSTTWSPTASPRAPRCSPCRATTPPSAAAR